MRKEYLFSSHTWDKNRKKSFLFLHAKKEIEKNVFSSHAGCEILHPFPSLCGHPNRFQLLKNIRKFYINCEKYKNSQQYLVYNIF